MGTEGVCNLDACAQGSGSRCDAGVGSIRGGDACSRIVASSADEGRQVPSPFRGTDSVAAAVMQDYEASPRGRVPRRG